MKTLAILSQKGGAGKTTISVHLAVAAELDGKQVAVIDLDPQASATDWGDSREREVPVVVSAQAKRLEKVLIAAEAEGTNFTIIDTAPHSESASLAAARHADLALIPCRAAILDLRAIGHTIDLVKLAGVNAAILLNAVPPKGSLAAEAEEALATYDLPVVPLRLGQRVAYQHALTNGLTAQEFEPKGKAAEEIQSLYMWTKKQLNL